MLRILLSSTSYWLQRQVDRLEERNPAKELTPHCLQYPVLDTALGPGSFPGLSSFRQDCEGAAGGLAGDIQAPDLFC